MATFTPLLRPDKAGPDGRAPIYLAVRHGGKKRLVALNLRVRVRDWNAQRHVVRKTEPEHNRINELLGQAVAAGRSALLDRQAKREPVTAEALAEDVRVQVSPPSGEPNDPREAADFLAFYRSLIEGYKARGQTSTAKAHGTAIQRLAAFTGGRLLFEDLTPALLQTWGRTMRAPAPHGDGLKQNYVRKLLTSVRTVCRQALRFGVAPSGWVDPYIRLAGDALFQTERVTKGRLTPGEILALSKVQAATGSEDELVRDAFVAAFLIGGMRFGDVALLKWTDVKRDRRGQLTHVAYKAEKTGKETSVPIVPDAAALLGRYEPRDGSPFVFPFLDRYDLSTPARRREAISSRNARTNRVLKKLAKRAGIAKPERVTTHLARHSLAAHLLDSGMSSDGIKETFRHSSVKVTEGYLSGIDRGLQDAAYRKAMGDGLSTSTSTPARGKLSRRRRPASRRRLGYVSRLNDTAGDNP